MNVSDVEALYQGIIHGPLLSRCAYFGDSDTPQQYAVVTGKLAVMWFVVYVACILLAKILISMGLKPSTEQVENTASKLGQRFAAIIKAFVVSGIAVTALLTHYRNLGPEDWTLCHTSTEVAGDFFTSYEIMELIVAGLFQGLLTIDFLIHHIIHITMGLLIRYNCFVGFYGDVLMAQELSSPFMMMFFICRGRYGESNPVTAVSLVLFVVNFFIWRVCLGTFGAVHWVVYHGERTPPHVPMWCSQLVCFLMVGGAMLQMYWFKSLVTKLMKFVSGTKRTEKKGE